MKKFLFVFFMPLLLMGCIKDEHVFLSSKRAKIHGKWMVVKYTINGQDNTRITDSLFAAKNVDCPCVLAMNLKDDSGCEDCDGEISFSNCLNLPDGQRGIIAYGKGKKRFGGPKIGLWIYTGGPTEIFSITYPIWFDLVKLNNREMIITTDQWSGVNGNIHELVFNKVKKGCR